MPNTKPRRRRRIRPSDGSNKEDLRIHKREKQKEAYLKRLQDNMGLITKTANDMGLSRRTPEKWRVEDEEFNERVLEILSLTRDWVEGKLIQNINAGNFQAQRFYLRCKGYTKEVPDTWIERNEIAGADDAPIKVNATLEDRRERISDPALLSAVAKAMEYAPEAFEDQEEQEKGE